MRNSAVFFIHASTFARTGSSLQTAIFLRAFDIKILSFFR
jgi:hypothetical protein